MAVSDPVADFLTRIRNGIKAQHRYVDVEWSKMKQTLVEILKNQGFIENYLVKVDDSQRGTIRLFLKYTSGRRPVIQGLKRISKPGLRKYVGHQDIHVFTAIWVFRLFRLLKELCRALKQVNVELVANFCVWFGKDIGESDNVS